MAQTELEQALRDFERIATLQSDDGVRQVWRFEFQSKTYLLHFYPRRGFFHRIRGSGSLLEFIRFQDMQRAGIPSPKAVAHLSGFHIRGVRGDALIIQAVPEAVALDEYFQRCRLDGKSIPQRRELARQLVDIVESIGRAKFGHRNLGLGSFLVSGGKIYLNDMRGLRRGGMRLKDILTLAHDASRFATRGELLLGWFRLNPDTMPPKRNPMSKKLWRQFVRSTRRDNQDFARITVGQWSGNFTRTSRFACAWSAASRLNVADKDWASAWPVLLAQLQGGQLEPIKQDASGDVFSAEITLAGRPISVIVKRPRRKFLYRYAIDLFRPARADRMWRKAWMLITRNLPCEWPMLVMRRTILGYTTDAVIIFERVPGMRLDQIDLDSLEPDRREMLFRRAGRSLRAIEQYDLVHYDSKSTNWIVYQDDANGAIPVMIDVDGIRPMNYWLAAWSILRLLRAMKSHPQYTPDDSLALCQGFAPYVRTIQESE